MPLLTWRAVEAYRPKAEPYKITLDRGLQLRIAPDGKRTLLVRYTVKGSNTERQYRLPQEYGDAPGQLKLSAACAEAGRIRALARQGVDWTVAEDTRLEAEASTRAAALQRRDGPTLEAELRDYVEKKRRAKDGLALKARTKSDYLAAIEPPRATKGGTKRAAGPLHPIAHKPLANSNGERHSRDLRSGCAALAAASRVRDADPSGGPALERRDHPRQPPGPRDAGRDRITITTGTGDPTPIPPELLGAWWRAAERAPSQVASDYYRFQLLTGCRGVEIHGHKLHGYPPIRVGDVDQRAGRVLLRDTKNRSDHKLLLSRQALEIAKRNCAGRKADEPLFPIVDARKTLSWINEEAGTKVQGHGLRATFASIAEELVSSALLKRMMNHAAAGDVTLGHYVAKSEAQLRAGWQAVADFVEEAAGEE